MLVGVETLIRLERTEGNEDVFVFHVVRPQLQVFLHDHVFSHLQQLLVAEVRYRDVHVGSLFPKHTQLSHLVIIGGKNLGEGTGQATYQTFMRTFSM